MVLYKLCLHVGWKIKIITLKCIFGRRIKLHWSDRIAPSVKIRINGEGQIFFGKHVEVRENCVFNVSSDGQIIIGDNVFINDLCAINARVCVNLKTDTMLGQGVKIYDHDHDIRSDDIKHTFKKSSVEIGERVWLCSNVVVLRGCKVGADSIVAAGTVVRKSISSKVLCYNQKEIKEKVLEGDSTCSTP